MKKRWLGILLVLCMLVCFAPAAMAKNNRTDIPDNSMEAVYVSSALETDQDIPVGNDETGTGTPDSPFASLYLAVDKVKSDGTIYLLSDLTSTKYAFVDSKSITIDGKGHSITRGVSFTAEVDGGRGGYNPAMIEVANNSTLTLTNITLDDAYSTEGTEFLEQKTGENKGDNSQKVQDAIIAAYSGGGTIILDDGSTLKNFGGMSAIRVGGQYNSDPTPPVTSQVIMKSGSQITDDLDSSDRTGGVAAIWSQGGNIVMEAGASIKDIDGRAIYLEDGGNATVNGSIQNITANSVMTSDPAKGSTPGEGALGGFGGIAVAALGNSHFTLESAGSISDIKTDPNDENGGDVAIWLAPGSFVMEENSRMENIETIGLVDNNGGTIDIGGTITNCNSKNVLFRLRGTQNTFKLQESGIITNCSTTDAGIVYLNMGKPTIQIDGEISDIAAGEIIFISGNGLRPGGTCTLSKTGIITEVSGDAILAGDPSEVTILGEISHCAGYAIRYTPVTTTYDGVTGSSLLKIESGARITDNHAGGTQILVTSRKDNKKEKPYSADTAKKHILISNDDVILSNRGIELDNGFTITLSENYDDVKLGNLSTDNDTTLNEESSKRGWQNALATFWVESETAQELTLSGLASISLDDTLPIYALVMPTGKDGDIDDGSSAVVYAVIGNGDDTYTLNLPATYETGWAVALVQPSEDYGTLTLTPNPETLQEGATSYSIQYTATFEPSESFKNELKQLIQNDDERTYTLTFTLDSRLTGKDETLTKTVTLDELEAGFNVSIPTTTVDGTVLSAGDLLVTSVTLEGSLPLEDDGKTVTLVDTATVTVTPKPEEPDEPDDPTPPPYIPPVDPDEPADPDDTGVSDLLNTKDHIQYLFGYPDGTFGPENNMTRAEVAQMFYNLLLDQDVEITKTFDDVPANAWYAKAVNTLSSLDIISGVGDNKFEPERSITRAEFTAMAMKFAVGGEEGENIFSDVDENDWFYDAVVNSIQYGWIHGYGDGTFRPNNPITRAEVTAIVNNMLGRAADEDFVDEHADELTPFSDIEKHWAYYHIVEATNDHDYTKPSSGENWTKLN